MKKLYLYFILVFFISLISFQLINYDMFSFEDEPVFINDHSSYKPQYRNSFSGHKVEEKFFEEWNHPYGNKIPIEVQRKMWSELHALGSEQDFENVVSPWINIGPAGIYYPDSVTIKYTGRVKDIEPPTNTVGLRVGAASGGLWQYTFLFPINISNGILSPWLGTFATDPDDPDIIFAGTGEPRVHWGNGLWRTINGGQSWQTVNMGGVTPGYFYKIRFDPNNSNKIHAANTEGYFISTDNGVNWINRYPGIITDFAINKFNNSNIIYIAEKKLNGLSGLLKSTNGGLNFSRLYGFRPYNLSRSVIDCGNSPNIVYTIIGDSNDSPLGVFRSDNSGLNWTNITPQNMMHFDVPSVEYMSMITVCPSDPYIVMIGTKSMCRTTNGGASWTEYIDFGQNNPYRKLHGDHHRMAWKDGNTVYSANDGGIAISTDKGATWNNSINTLPITQVYHFDVGINNKNVLYAGTQDNGIIKSENLGSNWLFLYSGDGGTIEIDPQNSNKVYATHNDSGGGVINFSRFKTINSGLNWFLLNNGLPTHNDWVTKITSDKTPPLHLYTNAGPYVYKSTNDGANWFKMNATAFPTPKILNLIVSKYEYGGAVVFACLRDSDESVNHTDRLLRVFDNGVWYERSAGLPQSGAFVRNIAIHPLNSNVAYALMNGFAGNKVFKTENRGINWTNITGNLPNVPVSDLVPHPTETNKLYLSSETGCFKTSNGGVNWIRWNYGMPGLLPQSEAYIVNDLEVIDSLAQNGKYYILAGTYGRGIWMREISADDPIGIIKQAMPYAFKLSQNYPNPFNPKTHIDYSIANTSNVKIIIYDIIGRIVITLVDEKKLAGKYTEEFNADGLSSGIYFYRLTADDFTDTKKMILLK